jgi:hypothetical protein
MSWAPARTYLSFTLANGQPIFLARHAIYAVTHPTVDNEAMKTSMLWVYGVQFHVQGSVDDILSKLEED